MCLFIRLSTHVTFFSGNKVSDPPGPKVPVRLYTQTTGSLSFLLRSSECVIPGKGPEHSNCGIDEKGLGRDVSISSLTNLFAPSPRIRRLPAVYLAVNYALFKEKAKIQLDVFFIQKKSKLQQTLKIS